MRSKSKTDLLSIIKHAKFSVAVTPDKTGGGAVSDVPQFGAHDEDPVT